MPDLPLCLLLDQNVAASICLWRTDRKPRWQLLHTGGVGLSGATDRQVFDWAQSNGAIVVTFDEDFADQRAFPIGSHVGVIRLRVWPTTVEATEQALQRLPDALTSDDQLVGTLTVVGQRQIRLRRPDVGR